MPEVDCYEMDKENRVSGKAKMQGVPDIKVITEIRRCGKSKVMEAFIKDIKNTDANANIISIDHMK